MHDNLKIYAMAIAIAVLIFVFALLLAFIVHDCCAPHLGNSLSSWSMFAVIVIVVVTIHRKL